MEKKKRKRPSILKKMSSKRGLPPGTVVHVGETKLDKPELYLIAYNKERIEEPPVDLSNFFRLDGGVSWLNINGLHDPTLIKEIGKQFDLHPLVLEDIVNTAHRPKVELFENYIYVVMKMLTYSNESGLSVEQVSLVLGRDFVLSFQERPGNVFNPLRELLRKGKGKVRSRGSEYLLYSLVDAIVDNYFTVLEFLGDRLEELEEQLTGPSSKSFTDELYRIKRDLVLVRKSIFPVRELLSHIQREESELIAPETAIYWRDVYDHTIQIIDGLEALRDLGNSLREMHMTQMSNHMNNIMKVLTIIATIFIPITFVAGIYGMNFQTMPELQWKYGYLFAWVLFVGVAGTMLGFFRKNRWL